MNEMKPEDVMRALECCTFNPNCEECPFTLGREDCTSLDQLALALLRKKDALIAELTQTNAHYLAKKTEVIEELQLGWSEDQERVRKILDAKDAKIADLEKEIERKAHILESYALQYGTVMDQSKAVKEIRDEVITEFTERLKAHECLSEYPWDEPFVLAGCIDQIAKEMKGEI